MKVYRLLLIVGAMWMALGFTACSVPTDNGLYLIGIPTWQSGCEDLDELSLGDESTTTQIAGAFDLQVWVDDNLTYYLPLAVGNSLDSNANANRSGSEGNDMQLIGFKVSFEVPEGWPDTIPDRFIDAQEKLEPRKTTTYPPMSLLDSNVLQAIMDIYDAAGRDPRVDPTKYQTLFVTIQAVGHNSAGDTIRSNPVLFYLSICRGCRVYEPSVTIDATNAADFCCSSPYGGGRAQQQYNADIEFLIENNQCNPFQDVYNYNIPCIWLEDCYNKIGCNQFTDACL